MNSSRFPNLLLGWCFSALAIAAISMLVWAYASFAPPKSAQTVCLEPISVEIDGQTRLGCASELDREPCRGAQAGDHIKWIAGSCQILTGAMKSQFRLAANLPLDLNRVDAKELQLLEGVGPSLAKALLKYRDDHGPFATVESLLNVRGIGPKTLERLRPHLFVGSGPRADATTNLAKE
uniref:DNA uptake protein and related DNA-binding proteins n=1 Tax=uncultured myxobacterium HF0200_19H16 TaxID=723559 RepID=E7C3X3_9BACT|nr:DNA uptake protein and related DNA-binding proteins [uncultured myxobacterium HF0200_19H16]